MQYKYQFRSFFLGFLLFARLQFAGDPQGDETGGESIWEGEFEEEFHPLLKQDKRATVSMANASPNTNGYASDSCEVNKLFICKD
jgi:hypothetical protein